MFSGVKTCGWSLALGGRRLVHRAAALAGEEVLVAPVRDVLADQLLRHAVVGRRVDEVDAGVEHRVEDLAGGAALDVAPGALATPQLHGAVPELGDFEAGAPQCRGGEIAHDGSVARAGRYRGLVCHARMI